MRNFSLKSLSLRRHATRWTAAGAFVAVLLGSAAPASASSGRRPRPSSGQSAVAVEGVGLVSTSGSIDRPHATASVAKVMDAYQVLLDHPLGPRDSGPTIVVERSEAAAYYAERFSGQTLVPVYSGERISERQALEAMLLPSANDMARILARWDAGSIRAFLNRENQTAARLGMSHTHFTDPAGVDAGTVSTAPDLVRLAQVAMAIPTFAHIVGETSAKVPAAGTVHNSNPLLGHGAVVGVKTGWTGPAGGCLMFAASVKGRSGARRMVYGVVLGQPGRPPAGIAPSVAVRLIDAARTAAR